MNQFSHKVVDNCPHCQSKEVEIRGKTSLGYKSYKCHDCIKVSNERTDTVFNFLEYPTDIVMLAVRWYLSYKLSYRDISEMFLEKGFEFSHETIRDWVEKFGPLISEKIKKKRKFKAGESFYVDETYIKVKGKWVYVYRGIDRSGMLVNSMASKKRNMKAAKKFFGEVKAIAHKPNRVTTDGHPSYPKAIAEKLGVGILHRVNAYLINFTEQSHRPLKQRYYPMLGFGSFKGAEIFCEAFDELRSFFKIRSTKKFTAKQKRCIRASKIYSFNKMVQEM